MTGAFTVHPASLEDVAGLRSAWRAEAGAQIVRDSILPRGLADPHRLLVGEDTVGYAAIWNRHFPNRAFELVLAASHRDGAPAAAMVLAERAGAVEIEAQSNLPGGAGWMDDCADDIHVENLLFAAARQTRLERPDLTFRRRRPGDPDGSADGGPEGDWVVERDGRLVAGGGWLTHYNPPFADVYMGVVADARGEGIGSFIVQELRRTCAQHGFSPAARCDPDNPASRRALERGGFDLCGEILVGRLR
jgi:GNAT superfamily N-acetyltransferase